MLAAERGASLVCSWLLLLVLFGDLRAYLALQAGAEMWIQCLTLHIARKVDLKAHICTSELCLRARTGTVAIQLSELFNPVSLQKGETGYWKWSLSALV